MGATLLALVGELRGWASGFVALAFAEVRRSLLNSAWVVAAAIGAAALGALAWFAGVLALVAWGVGLESAWIKTFFIVAGIHVLIAAVLAFWARSRLHHIHMTATLMRLQSPGATAPTTAGLAVGLHGDAVPPASPPPPTPPGANAAPEAARAA